MIKDIDSTRLIDHASGWSDQGSSDFHSRHIYFTKVRFKRKHAQQRILALTKFGGYSLPIEGHRFNDDTIFGYKKFKTKDELLTAFTNLFKKRLCHKSKMAYPSLSTHSFQMWKMK
jgi:hypothetical protein